MHFEHDGTIVMRYQGDAGKLIDSCAQAARADRERYGSKMPRKRRRLSVPREVLYKIALERGIPLSRIHEHMEEIWKIAESRDYSKFRTLDSAKAYRQSRRSSVVAIKR